MPVTNRPSFVHVTDCVQLPTQKEDEGLSTNLSPEWDEQDALWIHWIKICQSLAEQHQIYRDLKISSAPISPAHMHLHTGVW